MSTSGVCGGGHADDVAIKNAALVGVTASDDRDGALALTASNVALGAVEVIASPTSNVAATIVATITAADSCGNVAATVTRTVALVNANAPTTSSPTLSGTCGAWPTPPAPAFALACTFGANADTLPAVTVAGPAVGATTTSGRAAKTFTWQAVDAYGNAATFTHTQVAGSCGTSWAAGNCAQGTPSSGACASPTVTSTCLDVAGKGYPFPWGWMVAPAAGRQMPLYQGAAQKTLKATSTCPAAASYSSTTAGALVGDASYAVVGTTATVTVNLCAGGFFAEGSEQIKACWAPSNSLASATACSGGGKGAGLGKFPIKKTCVTDGAAGASCTFTFPTGSGTTLWLHLVSFLFQVVCVCGAERRRIWLAGCCGKRAPVCACVCVSYCF
jgi:hypothetical protein